MYIRTLLFVLCLFFSIVSFCQTSFTINEKIEHAQVFVKKGKNKEAIELLTILNSKQAELTPKQQVLLFKTKGHAFLNLWKLEEAGTAFNHGVQPYISEVLPKDSNYVQTLLMLGNSQAMARKGEEAIINLEEGLKWAKETLPQNHGLFPAFYNSLGNLYSDKGALDQSLVYFHKALDLFIQKYKTEEHKNIANVCNNIGGVYRSKYNFEQAGFFYKKAHRIAIEVSGQEDYYSIILTKNLASFYSYRGDYKRAIQLGINAVKNGEKTLGKKHPLLAILQDELAGFYLDIGVYGKAEDLFLTSNAVFEENKAEDPIALYFHYSYMGKLYLHQGKLEKSLSTYHKANEHLITLENEVPSTLMEHSISKIGKGYALLGQYENGIRYIERAIELLIEEKGSSYPEVLQMNIELGEIYLEQNKMDLALSHFQYVIDKRNTNDSIINRPLLIKAFNNLSEVFYQKYTKTNNKNNLQKAIIQQNFALDLLQKFRLYNDNALSKLKVNNNYAKVFERSLKILYAIYQTEKTIDNAEAFLATLEVSKSFVLLEDILSGNAQYFSGIPDEIIHKEKKLKAQIAYFENQLHQEEDEEQSRLLHNEYVQYQISLDSLCQIMKTKYPEYYSYFYQIPPVSIIETQQKLNKEQVIIEYFIGESDIYVIKIIKDEVSILQMKKDFPLKVWTDSLSITIKEPLLSYPSPTEYNQYKQEYEYYAYQLYLNLLAPLGRLPSDVTIIPDGVLWNIPFDCLLIQKDSGIFRKKPYFAKEHNIHYQYSILLKNMLDKKKVKIKGWAGFAPDFTDKSIALLRSNLHPLLYNIGEVETISTLTNGRVFKASAATKKKFISAVAGYSVFHFATHADLVPENYEQSYLAFTPDSNQWRLTIGDIYNLDISAEMVVLSACSTGMGKVEKGEGMASLGRAFFYAGTKSAIMTQWQVNDQVTSDIMQGFYTNLSQGMAKDAALNKAKTTYILAQKDDQMAHPFYWAGFTPVGNMDIIRFSKRKDTYLWIIGGLVLFLLGLYFKRKKLPN